MRIYASSDEEALRTLSLLKDGASEGFISQAQYSTMREDVPCRLRWTNVFLRIVFFLFTLLSAGAAVGLFFAAFSLRESFVSGAFLILFAAMFWLFVEGLVREKHLYRHGTEEALAVLSVILLCIGLALVLDRRSTIVPSDHDGLVTACGALASFLIYRRLGLLYAFVAAMIFVAFLPHYWTSSQTAQHIILAGLYAIGLLLTMRIRRQYRFDYLDNEYSAIEAFLWLGLYLTINLQLSSVDLIRRWWDATPSASPFLKSFYWTTYVLVWCHPIAMLRRGLTTKDRAVTGLGLAAAILTLITNKPYLGWQRHSWDPMILGVLLTGTAVVVRRWLASGPEGARYGFTANRLSTRDKRLAELLSTVGPVSTPIPTPVAHTPTFSGGDTGGGGASSDF
jgi:hypothetical protein